MFIVVADEDCELSLDDDDTVSVLFEDEISTTQQLRPIPLLVVRSIHTFLPYILLPSALVVTYLMPPMWMPLPHRPSASEKPAMIAFSSFGDA